MANFALLPSLHPPRPSSPQLCAGKTAERKALGEILTAILSAKIPGFFVRVSQQLKERFGNPPEGLSIRSNNEDEDLISAGLFTSAHAKTLSAANISQALRHVSSSMYFLRSYSIRRFWNWQERNLSMPVLVHPYIANEIASGTGRFTFKEGYVFLETQLVLDDGSKATNPSVGSKIVSFSFESTSPTTRPIRYMTPQERSVLQLFSTLAKKVTTDFQFNLYQPASIDIEFLIQKLGQPVILQYKPRP